MYNNAQCLAALTKDGSATQTLKRTRWRVNQRVLAANNGAWRAAAAAFSLGKTIINGLSAALWFSRFAASQVSHRAGSAGVTAWHCAQHKTSLGLVQQLYSLVCLLVCCL